MHKQINRLQTHNFHLEKQLERLLSLNPQLSDKLDKKAAQGQVTEDQLNDQSHIAKLIANSTLMKSYEAIMQ